MSISRFYPCGSCGLGYDEHVDGKVQKCLFGPGVWTPLDYTHAKGSQHAAAILYTMKYRGTLSEAVETLRKEMSAYEEMMRATNNVKHHIQKACKHLSDDGSDARKVAHMGSMICPLCGWDDY